jgi:hypothetical protein
MEKKRGAMDAMCRTQIDLCEQQAEAPELSEKASTPQGQVPSFENPAIQAEIDRRVALALETRRATFRTPERPLNRRLIRRRRPAMSGTREHLEASSRPSATNVVSFPGPRRA